MECFGGLEKEFAEADAQVLGVSVDPFPSLGAWARQLNLWLPLLSDWPKNEVSRKYGVFDEERSVARRVTFVIDKAGRVRAVIEDDRDMERHAREALSVVAAINAAPAGEG
ncbi:MAG: redoxin domain-containing protein [Dehalococcoidia bacterium]